MTDCVDEPDYVENQAFFKEHIRTENITVQIKHFLNFAKTLCEPCLLFALLFSTGQSVLMRYPLRNSLMRWLYAAA